MNKIKTAKVVLLFIFLLTACGEQATVDNTKGNKFELAERAWMLGPFERPENEEPIIRSNTSTHFKDPMSGAEVAWHRRQHSTRPLWSETSVFMFYIGQNRIA